ncbi:MAG: glycosyltransferase, partial [Candidatus Binatia bacterium]
AALEDQARAGGRVLFTGAVPRAEALATLRGADVFVLNSTYEGLPHVVLEAMAEGIPVVATRAGGTPELITDGVHGRLVAPGADEELERAIREVVDEPALARRLAAAARHRIHTEFGFRRMVDETERRLRSAAAQRRSSRIAST